MKNSQKTVLIILRILIGWHFLYEGMVKLLNPNWSSGGYLADSKGWFADWFMELTVNPTVLQTVDFVMMWGLVAIGLGLILGLLTRSFCIAGMVVLGLFYLSHPPLIGFTFAMPSEGSYLLVDKNLIELFALAVLTVYPTGRILGLDRIMFPQKA